MSTNNNKEENNCIIKDNIEEDGKSDSLSYNQLLILVIVGLFTWLGVNTFLKKAAIEGNDKIVSNKISLSDVKQFDELEKFKSKTKGLEKTVNEKDKELQELRKQLNIKDNVISTLNYDLKKQTESIKNINNVEGSYNKLNEAKIIESKLKEIEELKNDLSNVSNSKAGLETLLKECEITINKLIVEKNKLNDWQTKAIALINVLRKENNNYKEEKSILGTVRKAIKDKVGAYAEETDSKSKYVVLTQSVNVELNKTEVSYIFGNSAIANADLSIIYNDNKVQYYVDLEKISNDDINYDFLSKTLNVHIPSPKIDVDFVDIQSNPEKILQNNKSSWISLGIDIEKMKEDIQKKVREKVLEAGSNDMFIASARRNAKEKMKDFILKFLGEYLNEKGLELNIIISN